MKELANQTVIAIKKLIEAPKSKNLLTRVFVTIIDEIKPHKYGMINKF